MISWSNIKGIADAEARLTRRLARFWIFQFLALGIMVLFYSWYAFLHAMFSSQSGTIALITPRFLVAYLGVYHLMILLFGLVFIAFEVRARDKKQRIWEVLDALPFSNIELLLGKYLGILFVSWVPTVLSVTFLLVLGLIVKETVMPLTLPIFAVLMAIPAFTVAIGAIFFLTLLLKNRLIASIVAILLGGAAVVIDMAVLPMSWAPMLDLTGGFSVPWPTDLTPRLINLEALMQRGGTLIFGFALLAMAAAVHPRKDDVPRSRLWAVGGLLALIAISMLLYVSLDRQGYLVVREEWRGIHEQYADAPTVDIERIAGEVDIDPGKRLTLDLELRFRAPADTAIERPRLSLNPGLEVEAIAENGSPLSYTHEAGLLELDRSLAAGESVTLSLQAKGAPNDAYAYLDAVFEPADRTLMKGNIVMVGIEPLVFERDYVALLPGMRWLPAAGTEVGRGDPRRDRPQDFFESDLLVRLPKGWLAAGPAKRVAEGDAFRFRAKAPVPGVALLAAPFESRNMTLDNGVTLEVLVHGDHTANLELFADSAEEITGWIAERMEGAAESGLPYPYDSLTMVEVPYFLRGYAGGWHMDSTFAQPAIVMVRENSFPTARFDIHFDDPEEFEGRDGGIARAKFEALGRFFENDFTGGNPFLSASKSFFEYQAAGRGDEAIPLDWVQNDLAKRLVTDKAGYFSVHHFEHDLNAQIGSAIGSVVTSDGSTVAESVIDSLSSRMEVWDQILGVGLSSIDPWENPRRAVDVLTIKGGAMARSLLDEFGRDKTAKILAGVRARADGGAYDVDDVIAAGAEQEVDLAPWMEVWLEQTELPGFRADEATIARIEDTDQGTPQYQVRVTINNDESVPGMLRLRYRAVEEPSANTRVIRAERDTEAVMVPAQGAVEIGFVSREIPTAVEVEPYLSLNRGEFQVPLPPVDEETIVDAEPFEGHRVVERTPRVEEGIVVDDLDEGFSVVDEAPTPWWQFGGKNEDEELDGGIPIFQMQGGGSKRFSRFESARSYGRYRHTFAIARSGSGQRRAIFAAELPRSTAYEVDYYLPPKRRERDKRGEYKLRLIDRTDERDLTFDAENGEDGWNTLGRFELADGEVRLEVSNEGTARFVLADAVRFRPVKGG